MVVLSVYRSCSYRRSVFRETRARWKWVLVTDFFLLRMGRSKTNSNTCRDVSVVTIVIKIAHSKTRYTKITTDTERKMRWTMPQWDNTSPPLPGQSSKFTGSDLGALQSVWIPTVPNSKFCNVCIKIAFIWRHEQKGVGDDYLWLR